MVNYKNFTKIDFIIDVYEKLKSDTSKYFIYKKLKIGKKNDPIENMYDSYKLETFCSGYCHTEEDIYKILIEGKIEEEKAEKESTFADRLMNYRKCIIETSGCKTDKKCKEYYEWMFGNYPQFV